MDLPRYLRRKAYGQERESTFVDRLGVWLSERQVRKHVPDFSGMRVGDFGCGYKARLAKSILDQAGRVVVVDVALDETLKRNEKITAIEGYVPEALSSLESSSLDLILCLSMLEHLWEPLEALTEFRRLLAAGGLCLINVPSWRGKWFLEFSAFKLGLSPAEELDDHKTYYDPRDIWPLLVKAGFQPRNIRCFRHKLSLNTFAVCRV